MTLSRRELAIGCALLACSYVDRLACGLRRRVRAHRHASAYRHAARRQQRGAMSHGRREYEAACRDCAGASHG